MAKTNLKIEKRQKRKGRIRSKIFGTESRPRLAVFKSNRNIYAQLINDEKGATLAAVSSEAIPGKKPLKKASEVGAKMAKIAKDKKITRVVFDRGGFLYTGHIKALAEGARKGGLDF